MAVDQALWEMVKSGGSAAANMSQRYAALQQLREAEPEKIDRMMIREMIALREGLLSAKQKMAELAEIHERLTDPPWSPAVFIRAVPGKDKLVVAIGNSRRVVRLVEDLDPDDFQLGDEVFLNGEMNLVIGKSPWGVPQVGETAAFERRTNDGRMILRSRDDVVVVDPAAGLVDTEMTEGDLIRWDRAAFVAYEKIDRDSGSRYMLAEIPDAQPAQIGGQHACLKRLLSTLTANLVDPKKAANYRLSEKPSILMVGPPGCGKTLMARIAAAEVSRVSGRRCRFAVVKPSEWESPYVGDTQTRIRDCFASLRQAADEDGYIVLFLDEVESIARARGSRMGHYSDKFLSAFLAEADGFSDRGNVAIISATNRKDLIAPEAYDRLSQVEIHVSRPDLQGARQIFDIHLPACLPFSPNGDAAQATRCEIVERAVSRLFDPNADNQLCTIQFRDGKRRDVTARDVVSGRLIEQICQNARQAAYLRDVSGGAQGIQMLDVDEAVSAAIARLSTTLTRYNVHSYLTGLPQDVEVVSVEPVTRRAPRRHRYLNSN